MISSGKFAAMIFRQRAFCAGVMPWDDPHDFMLHRIRGGTALIVEERQNQLWKQFLESPESHIADLAATAQVIGNLPLRNTALIGQFELIPSPCARLFQRIENEFFYHRSILYVIFSLYTISQKTRPIK